MTRAGFSVLWRRIQTAHVWWAFNDGPATARLVGAVFGLSVLLAALQLAASLSVLAIYGYVLPTTSVASLAALAGGFSALVVACAWLDMMRARLLCRAGLAFVEDLDRRVAMAMRSFGERRGREALADLERIAGFAGSAGPSAFLDVVWLPVCLAVSLALHPVLALFVAIALLLLAAVGVASDNAARERAVASTATLQRRIALHQDTFAPVGRRTVDRGTQWRALSRRHFRLKIDAAESAVAFASAGKGLRMALQLAGIALCALLVVHESISPAAMVASSIIIARAFTVLDTAALYWRAFAAARESYTRIVAKMPVMPAANAVARIDRSRERTRS